MRLNKIPGNFINSEDDEVELFGTALKTSDNKLDFSISQQQIQKLIENCPVSHIKEIQELVNKHKLKYSQFKFELLEGFNLLFYGYGSKQELLLDFSQLAFPTSTFYL